MITSVTTNGDFLDDYESLAGIRALKGVGLDFLVFSHHSYTPAGLQKIIRKARIAAREGLISVVSVVFTADRAETLPQVAETCAENGIIFSTSIVQEIGTGFSAVPTKSNIPTSDQQKNVFDSLLPLKKAGFILNNQRYLKEAVNFPGNSWRCSPYGDSFIHLRAVGEKGEIGVCPEVRTGLSLGEITLQSPQWREKKRDLVEKCKGCLYSCYYQSENTDFKGDLRTLLPMVLVKMGHWELARLLGRWAVRETQNIAPIPLSDLEKFQIGLKNYDSIFNRLKRKADDAKRFAEWGICVTVLSPLLILYGILELSDKMRRKKRFDIDS